MRQMHSMKQLFILFVLVTIIVSEKHEYARFSMPEEEEQDTHPLVNLGNSLTHRLTSTSNLHGQLIYQDIQNYYNKLSDVYRLLKKRDVAEIVKGFKVYVILEKLGGPPHLNVTMDYPQLRLKYDWRDKGLEKSMKLIMTLTKELWEDMQDRAEHLRSGKPEPMPVEESTIDWTPFLREVSSGSEVSHY